MDFGGYVRVSAVMGRDPETWHTVPQQREAIESWTREHGHRLTIVHEDLDVSGGKPDRENLLDLIERIEAGQLAGLVVARLDRFARSLVDAINLIERIDRAGGQFVSVRDGFDTTTPYGKLAMNILLSIAQFELDRHREQWSDARARLVERGRHWGPDVPFGYQRGDSGTLEVDPETGPLVVQAFDRLAAGVGRSEVSAWLAEKGVRTGRGGEPTPRWVGSWIGNRVYLGEARAGEMVKPSAHPALVAPSTFEKAVALVGPRRARSDDNPALLSGILRCYACRYALHRHRPSVRKITWRCRRDHSSGRCAAPATCMEHELEPLVEEAFFERAEVLQAHVAGDSAELERLRVERDHARHALLTFRDDPELGRLLSASDFREGLRVRQTALELADRALEGELRARPTGLPDVADLRREWPEIDVAARRQMVKALFDAVVVKKGGHRGASGSETLRRRVWFVPAGTFVSGDLPRSGIGAFQVRPFDDPTGAWIPAL